VLFHANRPRPDQSSAEQCTTKDGGKSTFWDFIVVAGGSWFCALERREGGVSVGCRVLGRVRWWKRRKGFGEWGWGGSGGGFVTSSRRYIDPQM